MAEHKHRILEEHMQQVGERQPAPGMHGVCVLHRSACL